MVISIAKLNDLMGSLLFVLTQLFEVVPGDDDCELFFEVERFVGSDMILKDIEGWFDSVAHHAMCVFRKRNSTENNSKWLPC